MTDFAGENGTIYWSSRLFFSRDNEFGAVLVKNHSEEVNRLDTLVSVI